MNPAHRLISLGFGMLNLIWIATLANAGTAVFNASEDRIEFQGDLTIEELYQQIGNSAYLEKNGTNIYILRKNMFGTALSALDLSQSEICLACTDNYLLILSYGKIILNNAVLYSTNGQGVIRCFRGASGLDSNRFGIFADNLRWRDTILETDGNSYSFPYKTVITNSVMEGFAFPVTVTAATIYWPSYVSPLSIRMSSDSEIRNVQFKDITWDPSMDVNTFQSHSCAVYLDCNTNVVLDTVAFSNINLSLRDNSNVGVIGMWSNQCALKNITGTGLNLNGALAEHAQVAANTFSDIVLEGKDIPAASGLISIGYNRYGHRGSSSGDGIEKLNNVSLRNFTTAIQSITCSGFEITDFQIDQVKIGADMGMVWMLNASEISYADAIDPRTLKHGTINNAETGYRLSGACTTANDGTPIPAAWGGVNVFSEDVKIKATGSAITTYRHAKHAFWGLNDEYSGGNYDAYLNLSDFYLHWVNCAFDPLKTHIAASAERTYIKDYRLITVRVIDQNSNPVNGAAVTIIPENNGEVISAAGIKTEVFYTTGSGFTALAADDQSVSPAILKWVKTNFTVQEGFHYTVKVEKDGYLERISGIVPGDVFDYRSAGNLITVQLATPLDALSEIRVWPNPHIASRHRQAVIYFQLPSKGVCRIYTPAGQCVAEVQNDQSIEAIKEVNVSQLASGMYLYVATVPQGVRKGKLSILK